jgi:type II secretory pathway pseudopilin PulG
MTPSRTALAIGSSPRPARRGFTIGEMVVALLLFSLVGGGILTLVMRQQRFYRSTAEIVKLQGQLRQGASVLPLDLRAASTSDTLVNAAATKYNADIYAKADWMIEFRRVFGSSMICAKRTVAPLDTITLLPKSSDSTAALTSWTAVPVVGDSILMLDDWVSVGAGDDRWQAYEVRAVIPATGLAGCPVKTPTDSTPVLWLSDTVRESYKIVLDRAVSSTVMVGNPVRFFRRVRYEIYQAPDQQWYLGYSDCLKSYATWNQCSDITPVSGPYLPYTGIASQNGLTFAYYDASGNLLAITAESRLVSRVEMVMRSATANTVTRTGAGAGEQYRDSLVLSIGIRNRR